MNLQFAILLLALGGSARAHFVPLFVDGDSAIRFRETCVNQDPEIKIGVPNGRGCGSVLPELPENSLVGETEDVPERRVVSPNGSVIEIREVGEQSILVRVQGKEVLRFKAPASPAEPIAAAYWHGRHWIVEYLGTKVVMDGEEIGKKEGYEKVFFFRFVDGKPFFFFKKKGQTGISYNGIRQRTFYEEVPHRMCCDSSRWNPAHGDSMVAFYGRRGKVWYWVIAEPSLQMTK
jgi:hypothetical protein